MPESFTYDTPISIVSHRECQTSAGVDALNAKFDNRDVLAAAAAGFVGSIITGGIEYHTRGLQNYHRIPAMIAGGAIASGTASEMMGGDFMDGFYDGLFVAGFNHAMHLVGGGIIRLTQFVVMTQDIHNLEPYQCKFYCLAMIEYCLFGDEGRSASDIETEWNKIKERQLKELNHYDEVSIYKEICHQMGYDFSETISTVEGINPAEIYQAIKKGNPILLLSYYVNFNNECTRAHARVIMGIGADSTGTASYEIADPMAGETYERTAGSLGIIQDGKTPIYNKFHYWKFYKL